MRIFIEGLIAGFAIAVPVGPIAVLLIQRGITTGFPNAFLGGLGVATADLVYAAIAVIAGTAAAAIVEPIDRPLRVIAVAVLLLLALRMAQRASRDEGTAREVREGPGLSTYLTFLGLTILNPATVVYFASLVVGLDLGDTSVAAKLTFVAAAFLASAIWQTVVVAFGAGVGSRGSHRLHRVTTLVGALVIAALAVRTALAL